MDDDTIITVDDARLAGHCVVPGLRDWFALHNLDFRAFIKNGITVRELREKGDALSDRVIARKAEREGR